MQCGKSPVKIITFIIHEMVWKVFRLIQIHEIIRCSEFTFNCSFCTIEVVICIGYLRFFFAFQADSSLQWNLKLDRCSRCKRTAKWERVKSRRRKKNVPLFEGPLMQYFQVDYLFQHNLVEISQNGYDYILVSAKDSSRSIVLLSHSIPCIVFF